MVFGLRLSFRADVLAVCLSLLAMLLAGPASAQSSQPPTAAQPATVAAPPEKVQQLIKLLDDPEVKS
ncbi:hypothetical protein AB4144_57545, partial [Rhizobiaceae sp. 2RAB30]